MSECIFKEGMYYSKLLTMEVLRFDSSNNIHAESTNLFLSAVAGLLQARASDLLIAVGT